MLALWTVSRVVVWLVARLTAGLAQWAKGAHEANSLFAKDDTASMWEQMQAEHRSKVLERSVARWEARRDGLREAGQWLADAKGRRLPYLAGVVDTWLLWALERSGTFDVWSFCLDLMENPPWQA